MRNILFWVMYILYIITMMPYIAWLIFVVAPVIIIRGILITKTDKNV
jgi:hypothetical protein